VRGEDRWKGVSFSSHSERSVQVILRGPPGNRAGQEGDCHPSYRAFWLLPWWDCPRLNVLASWPYQVVGGVERTRGARHSRRGTRMLPSETQDLVRHMEWADGLIWGSLLGQSGEQQEPSLLERLHHLHSVQWAYLQIWRGEPVQVPELSSLEDLQSLNAWARAYYGELPPFLDALHESDLNRKIKFPWAEQVAKRFGAAGPATLGQSVLQVVLHTTHHRGQVATKIRELGGEPPLMDFIAWLWMERPTARWESHPTNTSASPPDHERA